MYTLHILVGGRDGDQYFYTLPPSCGKGKGAVVTSLLLLLLESVVVVLATSPLFQFWERGGKVIMSCICTHTPLFFLNSEGMVEVMVMCIPSIFWESEKMVVNILTYSPSV